MKHLLALLCIIFAISNAFSQDYPNLITQDIDGNEINIQEDYINQGIPVIVHFFTTWNPWDVIFLDTMSMQMAYDFFGPDGTNEVMILAYECDATTDYESIIGQDPSSLTNFDELINFPIINDENVDWALTELGVGFFPSIAIFCPDGTIYIDNFGSTQSDYPNIVYAEDIFYSNLLNVPDIVEALDNTCGFGSIEQNVSGHVTYSDVNCIQDLENGMKDADVKFENDDYTFIRTTDSNGFYDLWLPDGIWDVSFSYDSPVFEICSADIEVTVNQGGNDVADAVFENTVNCPTLESEIIISVPRICEFTSYGALNICNSGILDLNNVVIEGALPANSTNVSFATALNYTYDQSTGAFAFDNVDVPAFSCVNINFSYSSDCEYEIGDTICAALDLSIIEFPSACDEYINTVSESCVEIIGSYDPNDKTGLTEAVGEENYIARDSKLKYKIRFQNTGTDTAFVVRIQDEIDESLDISTLRPIIASHDYRYTVDSNTVNFIFEDIYLVDSFKNEHASHGFVVFEIDMKEDLVQGTKIPNYADIFFDFNEPVRTNTFVYTIEIINSNESLNFMDFEIFPNPAQNIVQIDIPEAVESSRIDLKNIQGQIMKSLSIDRNDFSIDVSDLSQGMYIVSLYDAKSNSVYHKKLIISK